MKVYKSDIRNAIYYVNVNGIDVKVKFQDKGEPYCYGVFRCRDKAVCETIEALPQFGNSITILKDDSAAESEKTVEKTKEFSAEYPDVKRTQEANKILVNEYGYDKSKLTSKEDALAAARELNIHFPNL